MMRTPRIPQEIVDQIIDHLHDDLSALAQCSLTNSAWLPSVRLHHFREVKVTYESVKGFQDLLGAIPEIGIYVQILRVDFSLLGGPKGKYAPEMSIILHNLLSKLPFIQDLRLRRSPLPERTFMPTTITSVTMVEVWVDSPAVLLEWLVHLPGLRSLAFVGHRHPRDGDSFWDLGNDEIELPALLALRPLEALEEFSLFTGGYRMDWLLKRLVPSRLRVLSLCPASVWHVEDVPVFKAILRGVGPSLDTLEMSQKFFSEHLAHGLRSLSFSKCDQLRIIRFGGYITIHGEQSIRSGFEWAITFLGHLDAPNVTTVKFVFDVRQGYHITMLNWLGDFFALVEGHGSVLHNLKRVVFEIGGSSHKTDDTVRRWEGHIRQAATRLHAALLNGPCPGLEFEVAFLGHGVDTWPVTHVRPTTVATFFSGQETITWRAGYEPDS